MDVVSTFASRFPPSRGQARSSQAGGSAMVVELLGLGIVALVVGFVLYNHWHERYGDNHF